MFRTGLPVPGFSPTCAALDFLFLRATKPARSVLQPTSVHLQVIVPCYNPPEGWEQALADRFAELRAALEGLVEEVGLVVVNDGAARNAADENFDRLKRLIPGVKMVSYAQNRGKGYALRQGVQTSTAAYLLVTDIDFPYTAASMRRIVENLLEKGGIAAGNRDTAYYAGVPAFRRRLSQSLRWLLRHVLRQPIGDSQCGLKGFDQVGRAVFLETTIDRFLFDLEFLMLANRRAPVTPVPVDLRPGVVFSSVGWKVLSTEGFNFIKLFFRQLGPAKPTDHR